MKRLALLSISALLALSAQAQAPGDRPSTPISPAARSLAVETLARQLDAQYVFPAKGKLMAQTLRERAAQGHYAQFELAEALADQLNADLASVVQDGHLQIEAQPADPRGAAPQGPSAEEVRWMNFGIQRVERLGGNIGYLDLRAFLPTPLAGEALANAMKLLQHSNALIIDLRKNGGGEPEMVQRLASYFFERRTHLNDIADRRTGKTTQYWTRTDIPGPRYGSQRPLVILTAKRTFSAAEDFSYALQATKRATVIGETTGGGAHPTDAVRISPQLVALIPYARSVSPITGGNWEGAGVKPDVQVPAEQSLPEARRLLLRQLIETEKHPMKRDAMRRALAELDKT